MGRPGILQIAALSLPLGAPLALGGCAMTSTYGTGEAPEVALLREMTGGLISGEKKSRSTISRARRW